MGTSEKTDLRKSEIGVMEQALYVAPNGCYVVYSESWEGSDLRDADGKYIGDHIYCTLDHAKSGADQGGEQMHLYGSG